MNETTKTAAAPSAIAKVKADLREINAHKRGPYHGEHWQMLETLAHELHLLRANESPIHFQELKAEAAEARAYANERAEYAKQQRIAGNKPDNVAVFEQEAADAAARAEELELQLGKAGA